MLTDLLALLLFGEAIDVTGPHTSFLKFGLDMLGMSAIHGEAQGWPTTGMFKPGFHDVSDKRLLVHRMP